MCSACTTTEEEETLEAHREIALSYYDSGKFLEASGQYQRILAIEPKDADAWIGFGNCERELGNDLYTNATIHIDNARNNKEEIKVAQQEVDRAIIHHTKSREAFQKALEIKPRDPGALYGLGMLYFNRASGTYRLFTENEQAEVDDHFRAATKCFEMVIQRVKDSYTAHRMLAFCYVALKRRPEAKEHFAVYAERMKQMEAQTKSLTPNTAQDQALVDQQLMRMRKDIADTEGLIEMCDLPPDASCYETRKRIAVALADEGDPKAALAALESVLNEALDYLRQWEEFKPADEKQTKARELELKTIREDVAVIRSAIRDATPR